MQYTAAPTRCPAQLLARGPNGGDHNVLSSHSIRYKVSRISSSLHLFNRGLGSHTKLSSPMHTTGHASMSMAETFEDLFRWSTPVDLCIQSFSKAYCAVKLCTRRQPVVLYVGSMPRCWAYSIFVVDRIATREPPQASRKKNVIIEKSLFRTC